MGRTSTKSDLEALQHVLKVDKNELGYNPKDIHSLKGLNEHEHRIKPLQGRKGTQGMRGK